MTFDVAVLGSPFLDLTFQGLPRLPRAGEEVVGTDFHVTPGGTGMQAVAAVRLGLRAALVSSRGLDPAGRLLGELLRAEGVAWVGPSAPRTAVTAVIPGGKGPAMATFLPSEEVTAEDVASVGAAAVVLSLGRLRLRPGEAAVYVVTGPVETERLGPSDLSGLDGVRAAVMNEREAVFLTGATDAAAAARALARHAGSAVVTRGALGAVGADGADVVEVPAPEVDPVDVTGAGDLFVAAYLWADQAGLDMERRLRWATLYASLSTTAPTALDGALRLEQLLPEGELRGLTRP